jgi:hypothetical protein
MHFAEPQLWQDERSIWQYSSWAHIGHLGAVKQLMQTLESFFGLSGVLISSFWHVAAVHLLSIALVITHS